MIAFASLNGYKWWAGSVVALNLPLSADRRRIMPMPKEIRPIRIEGNIAYVPLTKGYDAIIDADDIHLVNGHNWCARVTPNSVYAFRATPRGQSGVIHLHQVIMGEAKRVDHIDGNGLNNQRNNMRWATQAQNQHNARIRKDSASGIKGVNWHKAAGKWLAKIRVAGKAIHLGVFDDIDAAATAYANASAKYHGEFGRTG